MNLRDKYNSAIQTAKGFRMQGAAEERDGKLYFKGLVKNQDEVNKIWDAIKTVPDWRNDIVAEVTIDPNAPKETTYTVESGDTLSKIAKAASRRCQRLHEDFQRQQGSADRSGQDQARSGAEDPDRLIRHRPREAGLAMRGESGGRHL